MTALQIWCLHLAYLSSRGVNDLVINDRTRIFSEFFRLTCPFHCFRFSECPDLADDFCKINGSALNCGRCLHQSVWSSWLCVCVRAALQLYRVSLSPRPVTILCVWPFCRHVYLHVCAWCSSVQMLDPLEMELHMVVRWRAVNPCPLGEQQVPLTTRPHPSHFCCSVLPLSLTPPPRETTTLSALVAAPLHSH